MTTVNVYLTFEGNCEEAFNFYKSVFGGEFASVNRFKEMPPQEGMEMPKEDGDKIMHISLPIGPQTILMASDTGGQWAGKTVFGNNFSLSINTDSKKEADRLYNELSVDGIQTMPMNQTFWGSYYGMFTDKFGINWMVSFDERTTH
ncbi:VOC family protein [Emticicia sp. BO119]|uniref:VOC family protein n=1 Tax=Emticicia sp. BO119 TaxID=2757768 RepID=UPI0015F0928F|nr:VOC family protein [Emticicia sp. BO119]MBA4849202.1 VOC family protein [Emticicia sp. BO119]